MAEAISELAEYLERDDVIQYILPPVIAIMKDSATEVKVSLMENIHKLAVVIGEDLTMEHIIPEV